VHDRMGVASATPILTLGAELALNNSVFPTHDDFSWKDLDSCP
jgi:hypothetical protein